MVARLFGVQQSMGMKLRKARSYRPACETLEDRLTPVTLPSGFAQALLAQGMDAPTAMEVAPDGRIFVTEQGGAVRVIKDGQLLTTPFLSLPGNNLDSRGERGLLGIAFDPSFASNRHIYLY